MSDPTFVHVTLVEGLSSKVPDTFVQALSTAIARPPALMVRGATPAGGNKNYALVTLELEAVAAAVTDHVRALAMHSGCMLSQWRLRVTPGVAPKRTALAQRALRDAQRGAVLAVDARVLAILSPTAASTVLSEKNRVDSVNGNKLTLDAIAILRSGSACHIAVS